MSRGFVYAEQFETQRGAPIIQRRLFKPRLAVQARRNPISGFRHIAPNPRIPRFVRADKAHRIQMREVAGVKCAADKDGPENCGYEGASWPRSGLRFGG